MKLQCVTVCILSVWAHNWAGAAGLGCEGNTQTFISLDTSLLPIPNVVASRNTFSWPDENFVNFGPGRDDVWCVFDGSLPYVNLTFLEPVVVTGFVSGGYTYPSGTVEYVNNFTIQYSTAQALMGSLNVFAPAINTYIVLDEPFAAVTLMLLVEGFIGRDICWSLAVIGCRMSETQFSATLTASSTSAVPTTLAFPACSNAATPPLQTTCSTAEAAAAEKDFMVLAIALPIAIVTIAAVAIIVTLGMCVCVQARHKWGPSHSIHQSNEYLEPIASRQEYSDERDRSATIREVPNILYTDPSSEKTKTHYEIVRSSGPDEDMQSNPNYCVPFQDQK